MFLRLVATEGVGRDLVLCVGLNFYLSSSPSISTFLVSGFLGSSTYSGKGAIVLLYPSFDGLQGLKGLSCSMGGAVWGLGAR